MVIQSMFIDPNGQIVPPEIVQQIILQQAQQMNQQMMAQHMMNQSECNSVVTDVTYRSGAPLISNQSGVSNQGAHHHHQMAPQSMVKKQDILNQTHPHLKKKIKKESDS